MRSSTSSSRPRSRRRTALWQLLFAIWVVFALIVAATLFPPAAAADADILRHQEPPAWGDFYLAHDRGGHVDHHLLFHDLARGVREHLGRAQVLFLGNSRLMFALDPTVMRQAFASGPPYYVLGFGHEEQDAFPLEIIRRRDLRPSLVVVNADQFFAADRSAWASRVSDESVFDAWKIQMEGEAAHRVRRVLHGIVPHYVDLRRGTREVVLYRSRVDGTWFIANDFGAGASFAWPPADEERPEPAALRAADAFKRELDARGARLVLCLIPGPNVSLHRAQAMAAHLGVPLVVPDATGLRSIDGSHLSLESARRVSASLLAQLKPYLP